jgi:hypothetical protein
VYSIAVAFAVGSAPGRPRQTGQTWVFGGAPKSVAQPQNIFDAVPSSTWVSSPITGSYLATTAATSSIVAVMSAPPPQWRKGGGVRGAQS